jgi:hypothetical protein
MTWQVEAVAAALGRAGHSPVPRITPVLCFVGASWPVISRPTEFEGVRLESERSIKRLLVRRGDLDTAEIERLTQLLASAFPPK